MKREYHSWYSPSLGQDMELLIFGHAGARLLVFPTSMGKFFEWEDRSMTGALWEHLGNGWIQMFCVDSVDEDSWYARWKHPRDRAWRQTQYDNYVLREVLPLSNKVNGNPFLITAGASFGAYHALNFAFRHPYLVSRTIGMSGVYDISRWTDGYDGDQVYFNNPMAYIPSENDWGRLDALQRMDIILVTGADDPLRSSTEEMSAVLWRRGIGNALRVWDGWAHDWPWWKDMLVRYIGGHD
ncbi:MAG: esterase family protein [Chloroflexota bacterium]|nr:MAG: esterase family protein [Chloroflexota bacterium]